MLSVYIYFLWCGMYEFECGDLTYNFVYIFPLHFTHRIGRY